MAFLVFYGFGCELWAPWSEELGRRPVMQASLFFVNLWHIPCAVAPNFSTVLIFRMLGGLSCAGGSVTMSVVADMWSADDQQFAIAYVVFSSVGGSVIGPVVGGFLQTYLSWHWCFWTMFLFGLFTQILHYLYVPETRTTILLDREVSDLERHSPPPGPRTSIFRLSLEMYDADFPSTGSTSSQAGREEHLGSGGDAPS